MIERAIPRAQRSPLRRYALRERAAAAREYVSARRRPRSREVRLAALALRTFATALVLSVGLIFAEQAVVSAVGALDDVTASLQALFPEPVIDRGPRPAVALVAPNAAPLLDPIDPVTNNARLVVSGRLPSFTLGGSVAPKVEIALNGSLVASPALDADGKFSATVSLASGTNAIVVTMVRDAERASALPRTIVLDTTPPTLTITSPTDGATVDGPSVAVKGKTETGATVTVNGHATSVTADGTFSDAVNGTLGSLTIDVVARDQAGNETKKSLVVTVKQGSQAGTLFVSVSLDRATARIGSSVTADVVATDQGASAANASVTVLVGVTQVASGRTDASGHYRVSFAAPAPDGIVQVVAVVNGAASAGRGAAQLEITR